MDIIFNIAISVSVISLALWVSKTNPTLAGLIVSLPISTMIVLALGKFQNNLEQDNFLFAKSILVGVPVSLLFFVPFLVGERLKLSFWSCYGAGLGLLVIGYFAHKYLIAMLFK